VYPPIAGETEICPAETAPNAAPEHASTKKDTAAHVRTLFKRHLPFRKAIMSM